MVTATNNITAMKNFLKYMGLISLCILAVAGCNRFDPEEMMVKTLNLPQCMKPVNVKMTVEYNKVTLDMKVFPDVEKYLFEVYSTAVYEDTEPAEEDLVMSLELEPGDIPYKFEAEEDVTLYYRIASTNETAGKKQSLWTTGRFKTSVDPAHICLSPVPEVTTEYDKVTFSWTKSETDSYLLEIYNNPLPANGNPDASDLYASVELTNDDVPYTEVFPAGDYYFRVKAKDLAGERKDSNWNRGSFVTTEFAWPSDENAFDYGMEPGASKDVSLDAALFTALGIASGQEFKSTIVVDKITWLAMEGTNSGTYKGDRITYNRRKKYEKLADNTQVASDMGIRFKILKPGTFRMFPRIAISSKVWAGSEQKFVAYLAVSKNGTVTASKILEYTPADVSKNADDKTNDEKCIIFEVTKEMLYGMDGAATIYFWHEMANTGNIGLQLDYYAPRWTSSL